MPQSRTHFVHSSPLDRHIVMALLAGMTVLGMLQGASSGARAASYSPDLRRLTREEHYDILAGTATLVVAGTLLSVHDSIPPGDGPLTTTMRLQPVRTLLGAAGSEPIDIVIPNLGDQQRARAIEILRSPDRSVVVHCARGRSGRLILLALPVPIASGIVSLAKYVAANCEHELRAATERLSPIHVAGTADVVVVGSVDRKDVTKRDVFGRRCFSVRVDSLVLGRADTRVSCITYTYTPEPTSGPCVLFLRRTTEPGVFETAHPTRGVLRISPGTRRVGNTSLDSLVHNLREATNARPTVPGRVR